MTQDASPRQRGRLLLLAPLLACGCVGYATVLPRDSEVEELASTPEQLERERGAPDEKRVQNGDEVWEYEKHRRWAGLVLIAGVAPLPLMLPVAHDRLEFRFRDETLVSARSWKVATHSDYCGLVTGPCAVPGCESDR